MRYDGFNNFNCFLVNKIKINSFRLLLLKLADLEKEVCFDIKTDAMNLWKLFRKPPVILQKLF